MATGERLCDGCESSAPYVLCYRRLVGAAYTASDDEDLCV